MPSSARKSSMGGARRGPQKAHIPYRGDNPEVGKKTGIAVQHVERKSDGFEPFEEILQQADGRTPPRPKGRKKSLSRRDYEDDDYDDEDGEQSMQLDSPLTRPLANARAPSTPLTTGRSRSSVRPVARTSGVDYDEIPSPRPTVKSNHAARNGVPGSSSLRKSTREREPEPASDSDNEPAGDYGGGGDYDMDQSFEDDYNQAEDSREQDNQSTPTQANFSRIEEEEEGEEEEEQQEQEPTPTKNRRDKGKGRAISEEIQEPEEEVEDEIANGLGEVGLGPDTEDESEQEPEPPVKKVKVFEDKNGKVAQKKPESKGQPRPRSKKENQPYREGVRKSKREPIKPLEWWRGEKMVYGRPNNVSGPVLVPPIKEILRIPKEEPEPFGAKRKRSTTRPRSRSKSIRAGDADDYDIPPAAPVPNPEEGWDDDTSSMCSILNYTDKTETEKRVAWTSKMVNPLPAANNSWSFDKVFTDSDFIAAGQLIIPARGRKPSKAAKDNTYVFYVIEGAVNFKIHETSMVLCTGGMFMVPRGNTYLIENICDRNARLFFTQARKVVMDDAERAAKADHDAEVQRRKSLARSPSTSYARMGTTPGPDARVYSVARKVS
ncbi:Mif2/CENP-C like-domain-containing protein [Gymnopilus junonius]|uniref:CENP-C homolog n=1 Tax=Gymnopilus junonius TaxID=109634 RepID=A0A9P5TU89_GYMJU|nr:Mif2/CENP-C like-domain-containing protein [Gymnopilus junonius]